MATINCVPIVGVLLRQAALATLLSLYHLCLVQPGHHLCPHGLPYTQPDGDSLFLHHGNPLCVHPSVQLHRDLLIRTNILHLVQLLPGHPQHLHLEQPEDNSCQPSGN